MTARLRGAVLSGLVLVGCQPLPPPVVDPTAIPPPAKLEPARPATVTAAAPGFDGRYAGAMFLLRNDGGRCNPHVAVTGMLVANNQVRFSRFWGSPIAADGTVQLADGNTWIRGRFDGRQFVGELTPPMPACAYRMVLNRSP